MQKPAADVSGAQPAWARYENVQARKRMHLLAHALQVVLRCSCLRQALVALGGDGSDGEQLVRMLASSGVEDEPGSGPGTLAHGSLLEVLSQAMLQQVLKLEADTLVAVMQQQQLQQ